MAIVKEASGQTFDNFQLPMIFDVLETLVLMVQVIGMNLKMVEQRVSSNYSYYKLCNAWNCWSDSEVFLKCRSKLQVVIQLMPSLQVEQRIWF